MTIPVRAVDKRNEARVSIIADLTSPIPVDDVSIRIMNSRDQMLLSSLVQELGGKFGAQPTQVQYVNGDPEFPDDTSAAVEFNLPIVPRGAGYLPLAPFIEAFAPYAARLRIVYDIKGSFMYRGYINPYTSHDISFTVDSPPLISPNVPEAFYSYDIKIKNSSLTKANLPNYPGKETSTGSSKYSRIALAVGAAIIILSLGFLLALFLPKRKETTDSGTETSSETGKLTGGDHD